MRFRPKGSVPTLGEILEKIPCPWKSPLDIAGVTKHPKNFSEYITATGDFKGLWEARRLFETSRRRLADFYDRFKEIADMKDELSDKLEENLIYHVNKITIEAIDEDDLLPVGDRKILKNLIKQTLVEPMKYPSLLDYISPTFIPFLSHKFTAQSEPLTIKLANDFRYYFDYYFHDSFYSITIGKNQSCNEFTSRCLTLLYSIYQNKSKKYISNINSKLLTSTAMIFFDDAQYSIEFDWRFPILFDIRNYFIFSTAITLKLKKLMDARDLEDKPIDEFLSTIFEIWMHEAINTATNNRNGCDNILKSDHIKYEGAYNFLSSIAINLAPEFDMPENVSRKFLNEILNMIPESDKPKMMSNLQRMRRQIWDHVRSSQFFNGPRDQKEIDNYRKISNHFFNMKHPFNDFLNFLKSPQENNLGEGLPPNGKEGQDPE